MNMDRFLKVSRFFLIALFFLLVEPSYAIYRPGLGDVATNILSPVSVFSDFVNSACIVIGGAFCFASIIKYFEHRRSPTMVPLSTVIFLLIAGLLLLALPILSFVTEGGIPYTLYKH